MASIIVTPPLVIAVGTLFPPVCATLVALRFYSRKTAGLSLGFDDWLCIPALSLLVGICAAILRGIAEQSVAYSTPHQTLEEQINGITPKQTSVRKIFIAVETMQVAALGCIKLSCMFFYRRIFRTGHKTLLEFITWGTIALITAWTISFFFALLFACGAHLEYLWTSLANEAKCVTTQALQDSFAVTDVLTDLIVLIFPLTFVWQLQLSKNRKIALTLIFLLGTLAIMASITRMVIYIQVLIVELSPTPPDEDLLTSAGLYFMTLEVGLGLATICLPVTYSLFAKKGVSTMVRSGASVLSLSNRYSCSRENVGEDSHREALSGAARNGKLFDGSQSEGRSTRKTIGKTSRDNRSSDIELADLERGEDGIHVTKTFETSHESTR